MGAVVPLMSHVLFRTNFRAAPEVVHLLLWTSWRVDVTVVVVVPWGFVALAGAKRAEGIRLAPRRGRSFHAAAVALGRCGVHLQVKGLVGPNGLVFHGPLKICVVARRSLPQVRDNADAQIMPGRCGP